MVILQRFSITRRRAIGMTLAVVGLITSSLFIHVVTDLLFVVRAFSGLLLVIGLKMFVRYRSETRTIASLLNDSQAFQP